MKFISKNRTSGFTLIELLVVIAIIGILSSVVLASLSTARQKSRDAKRISDVGQVQLALELYFDKVQSYPSTTPTICGAAGATLCVASQATVANGIDGAIVGLADVQQKFLPKNPLPAGGANSAVSYYYRGVDNAGAECTAVGTTCTSYALGANLERTDASVLGTDADQTVGAVFYGPSNTGCGTTAAGSDLCFDIKP